MSLYGERGYPVPPAYGNSVRAIFGLQFSEVQGPYDPIPFLSYRIPSLHPSLPVRSFLPSLPPVAPPPPPAKDGIVQGIPRSSKCREHLQRRQ